jgi:Arc/MetJ-type ribon-helix-helix transcriptional regulator
VAKNPIQQRADELYATGKYPNRTQAWRQAMREASDAATRRHREFIDRLDPEEPQQ